MLYAAGLLASFTLCAWITLAALMGSAGRRPQALAVGLLGACCSLWVAGEILWQVADTPAGLVVARRVMFLGICFVGVAWLWLSLQSARATDWLGRTWLAPLLLAVPIACYASLYVDEARWWTDYSVTPYERGPLFELQVAWNYTLLSLGVVFYARAALRLRRFGLRRTGMVAAAIFIPLAGNAAYLGGAIHGFDPTPLLLAASALCFRFGLIDPGLAAFVPLDRGDVLEQLEAGVLVADLEGYVVGANAAARRMVGRDRPEGEALSDALERARTQRERRIEVRCFSLRRSGIEVGTGAVLSDRTEAEAAARRLHLAGRLEAVGFLTAGIAHEVNNPLAYIRTNLGMLAKRIDPLDRDPETIEILQETQDGFERIARLVEQLRRFARNDAPQSEWKPVGLAGVAERAASLARAGLRPEAIHIRARAVPPVLGDEGQLVQVILNLLVNAVQADGENPRIEIEIVPSDRGVALAVLDRGPGIAPDQLAQLFDPFFTTKPPGQGTGLGLSLSWDIATAHGGRIDVANRPGGGAAFTLWLPAAPAA